MTESSAMPAGRQPAQPFPALRRILRTESRVYTSIARAIARRPDIEPGGVGIAYHRPMFMVLGIFLGLSAVEIPIVDLVLHPFPAVRFPILLVGIWGLTWMVGLLCATRVRPHTVGPSGIRVRQGLNVDVPVPWDAVASVAIAHRFVEIDANGKKPPKISPLKGSESGGPLMYAERVQDETNIEIELEEPVSVTLSGGAAKEVEVVRLWADDPRAFLEACRPHLV